jgi:hypothetical protein
VCALVVRLIVAQLGNGVNYHKGVLSPMSTPPPVPCVYLLLVSFASAFFNAVLLLR